MLDDGTSLDCELVLSCAGIVANAELARDAGLEVRRGVVVDASMRTSDPAIFAVGDVAELVGVAGGLWPVGKKEGEVAAAAIFGETVRFEDSSTMLHLKLGGIDVKSFGEVAAQGEEYRAIAGTSAPGQRWRKLIVKGDRVVGGIFVGETELAKQVGAALSDPLELRAIVARLEREVLTGP